ncbi:TPA: alpha-amylase, partial [Vibrio cholerae]|nr:alpha-amylase [Vibrio cholerae]
ETAKPDSDLEKAMKYVIEKGKEVDLAEVKLQTAQMALAKDPSKQADVDNAQSGLTDAQDALTKANMAMQLVRKGQTYADAQTAAGI